MQLNLGTKFTNALRELELCNQQKLKDFQDSLENFLFDPFFAPPMAILRT